jgi:hypothetical protein
MQSRTKVGIIIVTLAVAIIGSGVIYAWFSNTQSQNGNQYNTGTMALTVNGNVDGHFTKCNMKPGDFGMVSSWVLHNADTLDGDLSITFGAVPNNALTTGLGVAFWISKDNSHVWKSGDLYLDSTGAIVSSAASSLPAAAYQSLYSYSGRTWTDVCITHGTDAGAFVTSYNLPGTVGNEAQTLSAAFDAHFTLEQPHTTKNTGI